MCSGKEDTGEASRNHIPLKEKEQRTQPERVSKMDKEFHYHITGIIARRVGYMREKLEPSLRPFNSYRTMDTLIKFTIRLFVPAIFSV